MRTDYTEFSVSFTLERNNEMREHEDGDESFFDVQHISNEIKTWLSDLDFVVSNINIKEKDLKNWKLKGKRYS